MAGNSVEKWNKCFYVLGCIVFVIGVMNLIFVKEYPILVGLEIKE
jgi:sugar phosphate permease